MNASTSRRLIFGASPVFATVGLALLLTTPTGCNKPETASTTTTPSATASASAAPPTAPAAAPPVDVAAEYAKVPDDDLAVAQDFEDDAKKAITGKTYKKELEKLEKELAAPEP